MPERPPPGNEAQDASTLRASPLPEWQLGKLCLRVREGPAGGSSSTSLQASVWGRTHGRGAVSQSREASPSLPEEDPLVAQDKPTCACTHLLPCRAKGPRPRAGLGCSPAGRIPPSFHQGF